MARSRARSGCSPRRSSSCASWSRRRSTFPEEEIEFLERAGARRRLAEAKAQIAAVLATARQGALLNEGMRVVLAGQPNVGKSSLLNALAGAELAIVTDIPGTTRDKVGETIQIEGVPVHVTDTAGLREAGDAVEAIGVARSWSAIGEADAVVWLRDLTRIGEVAYDAGEATHRRAAGGRGRRGRVLEVFNKADAAPPRQIAAQARTRSSSRPSPAPASTGCARRSSPRRLAGRRRGRLSRPRPPCRCLAACRHASRRGRGPCRSRRPGARARRRGAARGARRPRRDHRHLHRRRPAGAIFSRFCIGK
jgi:tRNA modification GTPase